MFITTSISQQTGIFASDQTARNSNNARIQANSLFRRILAKATMARWIFSLTGRSNRLLDLSQLQVSGRVSSRHYAGIKSVQINKIRGSEGRSNDFDNNFRPLSERARDRWSSIFVARLNGTPMPAVDLIQVGDCYFVRDGHHRISVALTIGEQAIDAHVTVWDMKNVTTWEKTPALGF